MAEFCDVIKNQHIMKKQQIKIIGLLYLAIAIIGGFSIGYIPLEFINIHNLEQTFFNLKDNIDLFQLAVIGDGLVIILELFITILLYQLFENTDKTWSEVAKLSRLSMAFVMAINLVFYFIPLHHLKSQLPFTDVFAINIQIHFYTVYIWQVFFGIHMIALSILTCKHPKFHKLLSGLLLLGGIGYLLDCNLNLFNIQSPFLSTSANILLGVAAVSELSFAILLLIKKFDN